MLLDKANLIITDTTIIVNFTVTMKTFIIKNIIKTAHFLLIALRQYLQSLNAKKEKNDRQPERQQDFSALH